MKDRLRPFISYFRKSNISFFHKYHKPPYGGANQFILALQGHLERKGVKVLKNEVNRSTKAILLNAFLFDKEVIREIKRRYPSIRIAHRIDGPISIYRGESIEIDKKIQELNYELADVTIIQSHYSLERHKEIGIDYIRPVVVKNAANPLFFNRMGKKEFNPDRKIKLVATSWSDNPKKGGAIYKWLDTNLNFEKYEFTFIGRIKEQLIKTNYIQALPTSELAQELKQHDIYITASENDSCSNSLIEALSCGLPAVYLHSGGNPELVKMGGEPFLSVESLLAAINKVAMGYKKYQEQISVPTMDQIGQEYLKIFETK